MGRCAGGVVGALVGLGAEGGGELVVRGCSELQAEFRGELRWEGEGDVSSRGVLARLTVGGGGAAAPFKASRTLFGGGVATAGRERAEG